MTTRSIRRAAERKANKLARKAGLPFTPSAAPASQYLPEENQVFDNLPLEDPLPSTHTAEPIPILVPPAADVNAHLSAITSALTGHATLLPTADAAHYDQLIRDYQDQHQPVARKNPISSKSWS